MLRPSSGRIENRSNHFRQRLVIRGLIGVRRTWRVWRIGTVATAMLIFRRGCLIARV